MQIPYDYETKKQHYEIRAIGETLIEFTSFLKALLAEP